MRVSNYGHALHITSRSLSPVVSASACLVVVFFKSRPRALLPTASVLMECHNKVRATPVGATDGPRKLAVWARRSSHHVAYVTSRLVHARPLTSRRPWPTHGTHRTPNKGDCHPSPAAGSLDTNDTPTEGVPCILAWPMHPVHAPHACSARRVDVTPGTLHTRLSLPLTSVFCPLYVLLTTATATTCFPSSHPQYRNAYSKTYLCPPECLLFHCRWGLSPTSIHTSTWAAEEFYLTVTLQPQTYLPLDQPRRLPLSLFFSTPTPLSLCRTLVSAKNLFTYTPYLI